MSADLVFSFANGAAFLGWLVLAFGVATRRDVFYRFLPGWVWPLAFCALYSALIVFFFFRAPGGFDTLAHVQLLFTSPWAALAGWVHYLAFDLFIGSYIATRVIEEGLPRLGLLLVLPLTFLFGPMGLLGFFFYRLSFTRHAVLS